MSSCQSQGLYRPLKVLHMWIVLSATWSYPFAEFQDEHAKPMEEDTTLLHFLDTTLFFRQDVMMFSQCRFKDFHDCFTSTAVNSTSHQPPMKRACWPDCPVDCQLGQWQNWSPCSQSCEEGIQIRMRAVLVAPAFGGEECRPLAEAKECEFVECAWWHTCKIKK